MQQSKQNNTELIDLFEEFFRNYYHNEIGELAQKYPSEQQSLSISFRDIYRFEPDLADDVRNHPDDMLQYAEEALRLVDLPVDVELSDVTIRITDLPSQHIYGVGELRSEHRNQYLGVQGHISRVTACRPKITTAAFECQRCGTLTRIPQQGDDYQEPHECNGCERQGPFRINYDQSEFVDQRKIQLKQPPEESANGEGDKMAVFLEGDAADPPGDTLGSRVGEDAILYGVTKMEQQGSQRNKSPVFDIYLDGYDYEFEREADEIDIYEHKDEFMAAAQSDEPYSLFIGSMAPSVYPYGRWPLALRLGAAYLMGGIRVDPTDGGTYRGDVHMAIIGPPGTGKSGFSESIAELSPGCERRSATGLSSDVGLTAAAVKDDFADGDGYVLKPGVLPRAKDHAILDEADKTNAQLSKMNDALEGEQMASIDKGGISAKLKTRVGLMIMANPDEGRWDENQAVKQQVNLDESLWSRFDGIVLLQDQPNEEQDGELADYVISDYSENLEREKADGETEPASQTPVSRDAMRAWIKYARQEIRPELTETAEDMLKEYYVDIRNDDNFASNSHPTPRKLVAGIRFATAFARIRLSETVAECDVEMAIELSKSLLGQTLYDGQLDADVFTEATEKVQKDAQKERIDEIVDSVGGMTLTVSDIAQQVQYEYEQVRSDLETIQGRQAEKVGSNRYEIKEIQ